MSSVNERVLTDQEALYQAILRHPDDMNLRLAYADCLDGLDQRYMKCKRCIVGKVKYQGERNDRDFYRKVRTSTCTYVKCSQCKGTGEVPDSSDKDRAQLIKDMLAGDMASCVSIRHRHPEWNRIPCPECSKRVMPSTVCEICHGTNNLLHLVHSIVHDSVEVKPLQFNFSAGFISNIYLPLSSVLKPDATGRIRPTQYIESLFRSVPITKVYINYEPFEIQDNGHFIFTWNTHYIIRWANNISHDLLIPRLISDVMFSNRKYLDMMICIHTNGGTVIGCKTKKEAQDVLAICMADVIREMVWGDNQITFPFTLPNT